MNSKSLVLIFLSIFTFNAINASITWSYDNFTLTISGTDMPEYETKSSVPWNYVKKYVQKVVIQDGVTNIGRYALSDCPKLTSVTIPNTVTSIGAFAFYGCVILPSITIPNSVTSIDNNAFNSCQNISSVTIPNSITSIGGGVFSSCYSLASVTIPETVTSIGGTAFLNCKSLTSVTIPNSVTSIGPEAFYGCIGLTSITIPNSVTVIPNEAFYGCSSLTSVTIPETVTSIGSYAFHSCTSLISVTIPNSVTSIGESVFMDCSDLTSVTISNSLTGSLDATFSGCSSLTFVTIPKTVTSIGDNAFYNCQSLISITIPNSVTSIGNSAFYGCSGLTSITCEASTPPDCAKNSFSFVNQSIPVYVPDNSLEEYRTKIYWKNFTNIQAIPDQIVFLMTDGEYFVNSSILDFCDVSYTRTFNNTKWQALYIPFSMSYDDWKDDFDVAYINGVRQLDTNDDNVIDETIMDVYRIESGSLIPNTPYLIKAKTTGEKTISVNNATLYPAEENSIDCSTTIAKYTFTGTYSTIPAATLIENEYYAMGGGAIIMTDGSSDLKPYRWYMKIEARSPMYNVANAAKAITIRVMGEENETTGISQLQMTDNELPVYDLNGRRVDENALKPGIYIKSGKKVVIK